MTESFAIKLVCFLLGGGLGLLIGCGISFEWTAFFEYLLKREEMRMKYSMDIIKENKHDGE